MAELREVIPVIVLVALGMFLFVAISEQWMENDQAEAELQLEYLDCKPLSDFGDVTAFSGPGEVFSFDGQDWIRFTDVGELHVQTMDGSKTYTIGKAHLGLILLTGQSNSVYFTNPRYFTTPYTIDPGQVFIFGTETPSSNTLGCTATRETVGESEILDLVAPDGTLRMSQMYPSFCKDYVKESGKRILVLNTGIPGMALYKWDIPTGSCAAWMTTATDYLKKAVEEDGRIELEPLAVLWSQGESDAGRTEEYYLERLKVLVERLEDGTWGWKFPLFLESLPRDHWYDTVINPALAQMSLAETDETVIVSSTLALEFGTDATDYTRDNVHYTQQTYGWFGEAYARALAIAEGYQPVTETIVFVKPIEAESAEALPTAVTAYGTSGAAFELQVSWTESEGSYVGELSGNPTGTRILTGLTASATIPIEEETETETP